MKNIKKFVESIESDIIYELKETKRVGMDNLIDYMKINGFFTSPASTKYHGSYEGGLAQHSYFTKLLFVKQLEHLNQLGNVPEDTIIICSLLHDSGAKIGAYIKTKDGYIYNQKHHKGHAQLSIKLIEKYIKLTDLEKQIIKFHMGYYGTFEFSKERGEYTLKELSDAQNNKFVKLFHWCDDMESQFVK